MTEEIQKFTQYLKEVRRTSENTTISYERDLKKMDQYFAATIIWSISHII